MRLAQGVTQYVILGAGLDTFAYRNPFSQLRVFEVDFPATQEWKQLAPRRDKNCAARQPHVCAARL